MNLYGIDSCPLCENSEISLKSRDYEEILIINCTTCGYYEISQSDLSLIENENNKNWKPKLSYWVRNHQIKNAPLEISHRFFDETIKNYSMPNPFDQANNLIKWIGDNVNNFNEKISIEIEKVVPIIGSSSIKEVNWISKHLVENKLIARTNFIRTIPTTTYEERKEKFEVSLTFQGWEKYYELKQTTDKSRIVFMAMKYGDEPLEKIYSDHIIKAVEEAGFEIRLLRDVLKAGSIDDQLRIEIRRSKFLLVDLTHDNNGAYWEAGFAEGLGKPVIYLCEKQKFDKFKTHFDTNHLTTVTWSQGSIEDDMEKLKAIIRNTFPTEAQFE